MNGKLIVLITRAGLDDLERRATNGDVDARNAQAAFEFRVLTDDDAQEFGL